MGYAAYNASRGSIKATWREGLRPARRLPDGSHVLESGPFHRSLGVLFTVVVPLLVLLLANFRPPRDSGDAKGFAITIVCFMAAGAFLLNEGRRRLVASSKGLISYSPWRRRRRMPWYAIESVAFGPSGHVITDRLGRTIKLPVTLQGQLDLRDYFRKYLEEPVYSEGMAAYTRFIEEDLGESIDGPRAPWRESVSIPRGLKVLAGLLAALAFILLTVRPGFFVLAPVAGGASGPAAKSVNRGMTLSGQSRHEEAVAEFKKALELDPENGEIYYHLGLAQDAGGDANAALQSLHQASDLSAGSAEVHGRLANLCAQLGRYELGILAMTRVIKLDGENARAYYRRAWFLSKLGRNDEVEADLDRSCELGETPACAARRSP